MEEEGVDWEEGERQREKEEQTGRKGGKIEGEEGVDRGKGERCRVKQGED